MSQNLPKGVFHETEVTKKNDRSSLKTISWTPDRVNCRYLLECELENPSNIHEKRNWNPILRGENNKQCRWFYNI